jgi:hypothetical protein
MKDFDQEYTKCLEKIKVINSKIENRQQNNNKDLSDNTNDIIKGYNNDLFANIQVLKSLSKSENLDYKDYTKRTLLLKKIEDQYNIFKKQIEENVIFFSKIIL